MSSNDCVHLFSDAEALDRTHILGWPHEWPPWEHLALVVGRETRVAACVKVPEGLLELGSMCVYPETVDSLYEITFYRRASYSELPADMGPHVSRGARYIKEER